MVTTTGSGPGVVVTPLWKIPVAPGPTGPIEKLLFGVPMVKPPVEDTMVAVCTSPAGK